MKCYPIQIFHVESISERQSTSKEASVAGDCEPEQEEQEIGSCKKWEDSHHIGPPKLFCIWRIFYWFPLFVFNIYLFGYTRSYLQHLGSSIFIPAGGILSCRMQIYIYISAANIYIYIAPHGIYFPWPGIEPTPPALAEQSLNHWTEREVPVCLLIARKGYIF